MTHLKLLLSVWAWLFFPPLLLLTWEMELLNGRMTTSLINANIPLLCREAKGAETCKCSLVSTGRQWKAEAPHWWLNRVWTIPWWRVPDTILPFPLWTLKACFLPLYALAHLKDVRSRCAEWIWVCFLERNICLVLCILCRLFCILHDFDFQS